MYKMDNSLIVCITYYYMTHHNYIIYTIYIYIYIFYKNINGDFAAIKKRFQGRKENTTQLCHS